MGLRYQSGSRLAAKPRLSGSAHRQGPWCRAYRSAPVLILPPFFTVSVPCTVFFAATDFLQSSLHSKLRSPDTGSGLARQASVRSGALTDVPLSGEIGELAWKSARAAVAYAELHRLGSLGSPRRSDRIFG